MSNEPGILLNSSIPFVLVGKGRDSADDSMDRVLVRGTGAGIEIVGFIRETEVTHEYIDSKQSLPFLSILFGSKRYRAVRSEGIVPISAASDQRRSSYVLAWKGAAPVSPIIGDQFYKSLPDVLAGIENESPPQIEWALGRMIFLLQENEDKQRRRRRTLWIVISLEILVPIVVLLVVLFVVR